MLLIHSTTDPGARELGEAAQPVQAQDLVFMPA